jgi:hypothetical protein
VNAAAGAAGAVGAVPVFLVVWAVCAFPFVVIAAKRNDGIGGSIEMLAHSEPSLALKITPGPIPCGGPDDWPGEGQIRG